ncbi:unnamed protein product [Phyllotreta striolata]|uniref:SEC7 domain-containing protein n=1 Tax=Phyllotreta striolata TaxID=444603 RepID=A0A9N9TYC7_PHYSR|nr:unnamed protein product [Phyllotreta striolata]
MNTMALPGNGIFVVKGEISNLMAAMKRGPKWSSHSYQDDDVDALLRNFQELRDILHNVNDLGYVEPNTFLAPFLNVIRSEETTGPVTSLALSAVNKFLSYGLLDPVQTSIPQTIHTIADAVTHARFVGTDQSSDGVVLMRILQVLRTLTLSPEGSTLTNESLCEIMLSCFRICFETRLSELLRKTAEHYLKDMVQLIFMRLPQFSEDPKLSYVKRLRMQPGDLDQTRTKRKKYSKKENKEAVKVQPQETNVESTPQADIVDMQGTILRNNETASVTTPSSPNPNVDTDVAIDIPTDDSMKNSETSNLDDSGEKETDEPFQDYVNQRGIRFTPQFQQETNLSPYGLACVRELFRFLISLCNPLDKQNTDVMIHLGLGLLTVAFEISADNIGKYSTLLALVEDDLCRNLFALMNTDRLTIFAANLQVSFLLFESLRAHLKYQLECYLKKLMEIMRSESNKVSYEHKEIALDNLLQLWRVPGFHAELYVNYDCDMYCANLYEELTELLAERSISTVVGVYHQHLLSLDGLLIIIDGIGKRFDEAKDRTDTDEISSYIGENTRIKGCVKVPDKKVLAAKKAIKKWLPQGTEYFNQKPKKGVQFLQEHGVLKQELDVEEIARFLRENPALNKAMIGEYISNRGNLKILEAFVSTFDFTGIRIDEALRAFLETFRLPGEAPTISLILEHFAEHWHKSNGEPFADVDSAFTLAYAVIMLNVDQHNENAKKQTTPMSPNAFKKNLKGVNGGDDFEEEMLDEIYTSIKSEEIVMPSERTGVVRDNYLWKVLLRKGRSPEGGVYMRDDGGAYDAELFRIAYGPLAAALNSVYERADNEGVQKKVVRGFERCASIASVLNMTSNLDMLLVSLSKFTVFHNNQKQTAVVVQFGSNGKAQLALKTLFMLIHQHGNSTREGWKHLFDLLLALYSNDLLSKSFVEVEDFVEPSGKLCLVYKDAPSAAKQDTGLLSSLYSYMISVENLSKIPSPEEQSLIDKARECIKECNLEQMITDSKFLHQQALFQLVDTLIELSRGPDVQDGSSYDYNENVTVFFLELLVKIVIQNRDRVMTIWDRVRDHVYTLVMNSSLMDYQFLLERSVVGLLRIAVRLMRNEEMSHVVLQSLRMLLLLLKGGVLARISRQMAFGLYEMLKTSAQNIHTTADWTVVFALLECVGAGAKPPRPVLTVDEPKSDEETSTKEHEEGADRTNETAKRPQSPATAVTSPVGTPNTGGWIIVSDEDDLQPHQNRQQTLPVHYHLRLDADLSAHDPLSMLKCCESLAFLVRDVAHITPYNFDVCVRCVRTFVEAALKPPPANHQPNVRRPPARRSRTKSPAGSQEEDSSGGDEDEDLPSGYHQVPIQLLDLMHTLHTRTAQIFKWWAEEGGEISGETSLWTQGWCPLLQGIARSCCDVRRTVRTSAIAYLQRALLVHDLQTLTPREWEQCFRRVLFPLMNYLLQSAGTRDAVSTEETRIRAAGVLSKVFLHHLAPLSSLQSFADLWSTVLELMDGYMHADGSELLLEAVPESLKNMLLVMEAAGVFDAPDGQKNALWTATWERIGKFLPGLKDELFREMGSRKKVVEEAKDAENREKKVADVEVREKEAECWEKNVGGREQDVDGREKEELVAC